MSPLLFDGDYVLCCRWPHRWVKAGQFIVLRHPKFHEIIKRVHHKNSDGSLALCGENPASVSMQQIGNITSQYALWRVIKCIKQTR